MPYYQPLKSGAPVTTTASHSLDSPLQLDENQWVLVVEDSESDIILLRIALRDSATRDQLRWVTDGEQAITLLTELAAGEPEKLPDTIVLDLNLPRVDGYAILAHIRTEPVLSGVAVFVYTSSEAEAERKRVLAQGADGFLTKPADLAGYARLPAAIQQARRARSQRVEMIHY